MAMILQPMGFPHENTWMKMSQTCKTTESLIPQLNQPAINSLSFLPTTQKKSLFLSANNKLVPSSFSVLPGSSSYSPQNQSAEIRFTHTWTQRTTLLGSTKAILFISSPDLFQVSLQIQKADCLERVTENVTPAPLINQARSGVGRVVKTEIELDYAAMVFEPGEQLILSLTGAPGNGEGRGFIHFGECMGSRLVLPLAL